MRSRSKAAGGGAATWPAPATGSANLLERLGGAGDDRARRLPAGRGAASRNIGASVGIVVITLLALIFLLAPQSVESFAKGIANVVF